MKMSKYILIILLFVQLAIPVTAGVYKVSTKSQLEETVAAVFPGDTVLLAAQDWNDVSLEFKGEGSELSPIVFGAEAPGQTIFTGNSRIEISGNWLVVRDFIFREGNVIDEGSIVAFRTSTSTLANHCRLTNVTIEDYNPSNASIDTKYVSLYGTNNRVDHCSFSGKTNSGATFVVWLDQTPDYHLIDHNYFGPRPNLGVNGGETIRIGTSDWESYNSNCIVEYNLFDQCDGEIEIISNKSVGNHYRYNTFLNCDGTLTLRHGSYCKVYGNFFFGADNKNSGGVRIIGEGHEVYNNYFEGLNGTSYRAAISLVNGMPDSPASGYYQVKKAKIGFNTIINCKQTIAVGAGKDESKTLPPEDCEIVNNLIKGRSGYAVVEDYDVTTGITWDGNIYESDLLGISPDDGLIRADVEMDESGGFYRPAGDNVGIGAATASMELVVTDIDGQSRPQNNRDVGCDQLSNDEVLIRPLSKEDVGADYSVGTSVGIRKINKGKVLYDYDGLSIVFPSMEARDVSIWTIEGRKIKQISCNQPVCRFQNSNNRGIKVITVNEGDRSYSLKVML